MDWAAVSGAVGGWWVHGGWPWMSGWLRSPGFAGTAAVIAAIIAFVAARRQTRLNAWWQRVEWALERYVGRESDSQEREVGAALLAQLQQSSLGGKGEQEFLAAAVDAVTLQEPPPADRDDPADGPVKANTGTDREARSTMTSTQYRATYGRDAPTGRERQIAATIRVRADEARGVRTPGWIVTLADGGSGAPDPPAGDL